jgi:hypothetical protein
MPTPNARINRAARIHATYVAASNMKKMLSPLRFNELLCCSASFRRAERPTLSTGCVIADIECHVPSSWANFIRIKDQPTSRIIHSTLQSHNRGAVGDFVELTRSGDITPELTGRARTAGRFKLTNESRAIRAPVE